MDIIIHLDYHKDVPIYRQIEEGIMKYVTCGLLKPNMQIPSIRDMARALEVNPNTVRKAYQELEKKGVILSLSTKGTFINDSIEDVITGKVDDGIAKINEVVSELKSMGLTKDLIIERMN